MLGKIADSKLNFLGIEEGSKIVKTVNSDSQLETVVLGDKRSEVFEAVMSEPIEVFDVREFRDFISKIQVSVQKRN